MILRKIRGLHSYLPTGKVKIECLHEVLITVITNHPLYNENWDLICTNDLKICIEFLTEFLEISTSPICNELGHFLETTMAVLNRPDYRSILSKNFDLFTNIIDNLQLNPNNSVMCKCSVFKLPIASPFILPCKTTTYYCFIEIEKLTDSPTELYDFMDSKVNNSKF